MKNRSPNKRGCVLKLIGIATIILLLGGSYFAIGYFNLFHSHEHCIKQTGLSLRQYAAEHKGKFPYHTNGFGNAVLLLIKEDLVEARLFTAPGDNGQLLDACLKAGTDVPEERCTRAYVQGLDESNNSEIAIVFDRYPTRGGDHFRRPWGPLQREVALLDGSMKVVREEKWPEFRHQQIDLLIATGINKAEADKLYAAPVK